ncbi:MAG TPA: hypothetical protein PKO09_10445 [Anaerolineae bacterium]|nr:hypothetical protein [Anaerolineae bacterium]
MAGLYKAAATIAGLALVVLFGVWLAVGRTGVTPGSTREGVSRATATPAGASGPAATGGAAAASAMTETATFALG